MENAAAQSKSIRLDCLECSLCLTELKEIVSVYSEEEDGERCAHCFCRPCLEARKKEQKMQAERQRGGGGAAAAKCPLCRRTIIGFSRNRVAEEVLKELKRGDRLSRAHLDRISELDTQLKQGRVLLDAEIRKRESLEAEKEEMKRQFSKAIREQEEQKLSRLAELESKCQQKLSEISAQRDDLAQQLQDAHRERERFQREADSANTKLAIESKKLDSLAEQLKSIQDRMNANANQKDSAPNHPSNNGNLVSPQSAPSSSSNLTSTSYLNADGILAKMKAIGASLWTVSESGPLMKPYRLFEICERRGMKTSPVWRALEGGKNVALKKIFATAGTKSEFREALLLSKLQHDNILHLESLTRDTSGVLCLVLPYLELDLDYLMGSANRLTQQQIREILYQLLCVIRYLHDAQVVHLDIKPTSILFQSASNSSIDISQLKLASFSSARSCLSAPFPEPVTSNTIYHWPPEMFYLDQKEIKHWKSIDMFSCGALLAQLLSASSASLFNGYSVNYLFGSAFSLAESRPSNELLSSLNHPALNNVAVRVSAADVRPLSSVLPHASPLAIDLIAKLICFDAAKRLNHFTALSHEYFKGLAAAMPRSFSAPVAAEDLRDEHISLFVKSQVIGSQK